MTELDRQARRWAEIAAQRPGTVGAFLYGSLAGDPAERTEFSDIDVALVLEDDALPAHFAEHRLFQGIKTDVTILPASTLRGWITKPPSHLWAGHWTNGLFVRALTVGGSEILTVDPHGELAAAQAALPPYSTLVHADAVRWLSEYTATCLEPAEIALADGDWKAARDKLAPGWLDWTARALANTKRLPVAAQRLDLPEFPELFARWRAISPAEAESLLACCDAIDALTAHSQEAFFAPLWDLLRTQEVAEPGALEIQGDWPLFWSGNRLNSLERVAADVDHSRELQRKGRTEGDPQQAYGVLWGCKASETTRRIEGLRDALSELGYDIAPLADAFLNHPDTTRHRAAIDAAEAERAALPLSEERIREQIALAREAHARLVAVVGQFVSH